MDWRDGAGYAALFEADRSLFAWEWLRRDPAYRAAAAGGGCGARDFGLVAFEPPSLGVPDARPLWAASVHPYVLGVKRGPSMPGDECFVPGDFADLLRVTRSPRGEHLLLTDGVRAIRLDGPPGIFESGPTALEYRIAGLERAGPPLLTLRRLLALCRTGRFSRTLHRPEPRARRWVLMLRAADACAEGASQRAIAGVLLTSSASGSDWRGREPSIRLQAQRLVRSARRMASGGYRQLLA